jgi:hypothetical protein
MSQLQQQIYLLETPEINRVVHIPTKYHATLVDFATPDVI